MTRFEVSIHKTVMLRRDQVPGLRLAAKEVGLLYQQEDAGRRVSRALQDPFFPLSLYVKHHLGGSGLEKPDIAVAAQNLAVMSRMFLRIRADISRHFDNRNVTCIDLDGDARQRMPLSQWCSFCGECCQLSGTIPDPPKNIRYPGYWYTYIAGDSPLNQRFCPFLFELPPQGLFFCGIHHVKPRTCLAYEKEDCHEKHPGMARNGDIG